MSGQSASTKQSAPATTGHFPYKFTDQVDLLEHSVDQFGAVAPADEDLLDPWSEDAPSIFSSGRPL